MKKQLFISVILAMIVLLSGQIITEFPFAENFDTTANPSGPTVPQYWLQEDTNNDNVWWDIFSPTDPSYARSQPNSMHAAFSFTNAMSDWLFTPGMAFEAGTYQLQFYVRCGIDIFTGQPTPEKLRVSLAADASSQSLLSELYVDESVDNIDFQLVSIDISIATAGTYYIGFQSFSDPENFVLVIDDVTIDALTTANDTPQPQQATLAGNYPNPFNPSTEISYNLAASEHVTLSIYDAKGHKVNTLVQADMSAGNHTAHWDGTDTAGNILSSGIYFYKLKTDSSTDVKKCILMK